jgi:3-methyladenine DNA glycosylase AlkC
MSNPNSFISVAAIKKTAIELSKQHKAFDAKRFQTLAISGLEGMSIKSRVDHVREALLQTMPTPFHEAATAIEGSLAPPTACDEKGEVSWGQTDDEKGLQGWMLWALGDYVAKAGINEPERALLCLHALTQRFTAEFSIRPFLVNHSDLTYKTLMTWIKDPSPHVRRLVSEGSRPRLPWGTHLKSAINDPTPSWPIIEALQDDSSQYVRRSVANHLNDIAKDHPDAVAAWIKKHRVGASEHREALLRHASRTLATLEAWGIEVGFKGKALIQLLQPPGSASKKSNGKQVEVRMGGSLPFSVEVRSSSTTPQNLVIDYTIHHLRSNGKQTPKVFKGWKRVLGPKETVTFTKDHPFKANATRVLYPGAHRIDIRVNGTTVAEGDFTLLEDQNAKGGKRARVQEDGDEEKAPRRRAPQKRT